MAKGIIYTSTTLSHPSTTLLLQSAIDTLLTSLEEDPKPRILWSLSYTQHHASPSPPPPRNTPPDIDDSATPSNDSSQRSGIFHLKDLSPSLALEDEVLRDVRAAWERITAEDGELRGGFLQFEDREEICAEDEEA